MARDLRLNTGSVLKALVGALAAIVVDWGPAAGEEAVDDLQHLRPLINQTLETEKSGVEIGWSNPATGHSGTLRVERTFYRDQQPCREYLRTVERAGTADLVTRGTACRVGRPGRVARAFRVGSGHSGTDGNLPALEGSPATDTLDGLTAGRGWSVAHGVVLSMPGRNGVGFYERPDA